MNIHERFAAGMISGVAGGIAMALYSYFSYGVLHFATVRYLDWASVIAYGHLPASLGETVYGQFVHILFCAMLGVMFAYAIPRVSSENLLLKGFAFGGAVWFLIYAVTILLGNAYLGILPLQTAISNFIGSLIFGGVLAITFNKLILSGNPKV